MKLVIETKLSQPPASARRQPHTHEEDLQHNTDGVICARKDRNFQTRVSPPSGLNPPPVEDLLEEAFVPVHRPQSFQRKGSPAGAQDCRGHPEPLAGRIFLDAQGLGRL